MLCMQKDVFVVNSWAVYCVTRLCMQEDVFEYNVSVQVCKHAKIKVAEILFLFFECLYNMKRINH